MDISADVVANPLSLSDLSGGTPDPPRILLADLLGEVSVIQQQESTDRATLGVLTPDVTSIRARMTTWAAGGFQGSCDLVSMSLTPPNICSDGVSRTIYDYILFLTGKTLVEHLLAFQTLLPEFEVGYRCSRTDIMICVVRIKA